MVTVFTCNYCPTAHLYESRIKKLADDYRRKGAQLVAIEPNNARAIRLDELGYTNTTVSGGAELCLGYALPPFGARDYEPVPETVTGLHFLALACLFLKRFVLALTPS